MSDQTPGSANRHAFASPRFWPTWLGIGLLRLLHLLPFPWQQRLGKWLGRAAWHLLPRRRHIAGVNIDLCFPQRTAKARKQMLKAHFEAMGIGMFESSMAWWGSKARLDSLGEIQGLEHLQAASDSGRGVILLTGHFGCMELAASMINARHQISAMYRPMKNPLMDHIVLQARIERLKTIFPRNDIPAMLRSLKKGEIVWYGFDQDYGRRHSIFTPFFGIPAATITTTSRFARMGHALVIPYFPVRDASGRYQILIQPPLKEFPSGDVEEDTARLNRLLEEAINQAPEQYFWIHRRFKNRPEGEASPY